MTERSTVTTSPYTIGVAPFRPGDEPTFGGKFTEQPEDLNRPDPATCTAEDTAPHAKGLIRVLTDEGEAKGEWNPDLDAATLIQGLEYMMRLRIFDDRMMKMQRTGKLSFYMRSFGEEAVAIAQTMALEEQDWLFPSYRQPGAQFVRGRDMVSMICHCIGNTEDNVRGRQMPVTTRGKKADSSPSPRPSAPNFPKPLVWPWPVRTRATTKCASRGWATARLHRATTITPSTLLRRSSPGHPQRGQQPVGHFHPRLAGHGRPDLC